MAVLVKVLCAAVVAARFATAARVQGKASVGAPSEFEAVVEEEARILGDGPIDQDDAADIVRNFMRKQHADQAQDMSPSVETVGNFINKPRSSPEKKMLTCEQGTLLVWVLTKWRLDAASSAARHDLVACEGAAVEDSTCAALDIIAERCPDGASVDELRAERRSVFGMYLVDDDVRAWTEVAMEETDEEEKQREKERREREEMQRPKWLDGCRTNERIHVVKIGDRDSKCLPVPEGSNDLECPASTTTFCYHKDPKARCCCPGSSITTDEKNLGFKTKKYGTDACAAHMRDLGGQ